MPKVDFTAARKAAEKEGLITGGDRFKFQEGPNRMRVLVEPLPFNGSYKGTPNFKWLCYIIDRNDGQVKLFFMPHTVHKAIEALQVSEDYAFDEVPMPYDITVSADGAGTKEVKYTVMAARKNAPVTPEERKALDAKKPIAEVRHALAEKQKQTEPEPDPDNAPPFDPDEIPF